MSVLTLPLNEYTWLIYEHSTLMRLCMRLYDPDEGSVTIDGTDLRNYTQASLRKMFGVVSQDTSLFNKTAQI